MSKNKLYYTLNNELELFTTKTENELSVNSTFHKIGEVKDSFPNRGELGKYLKEQNHPIFTGEETWETYIVGQDIKEPTSFIEFLKENLIGERVKTCLGDLTIKGLEFDSNSNIIVTGENDEVTKIGFGEEVYLNL
jgi:hypothetical protein